MNKFKAAKILGFVPTYTVRCVNQTFRYLDVTLNRNNCMFVLVISIPV